MNLYIHTLNGEPAYYDSEEKQVFFLSPLQRPKYDTVVTSLQKLHRQQAISRQTRQNLYINDTDDTFEYGYARLSYTPREEPRG